MSADGDIVREALTFLHDNHGDVADALAALERLEAAATNVERITHGRHCTCGACAREDWTRISAPCGMHGAPCPSRYQPLGTAGALAELG